MNFGDENEMVFNATLFETSCSSSFEGEVKTNRLESDNDEIGYSIWISRKSQRINAKYFAHKEDGQSVYNRFKRWRDGKEGVLISSGAYATGWDYSDVPAGVTVDNGNIVNRDYSKTMDALVIVYATGGVVVSNIEDGDLYLVSLDRKVNVKNTVDRSIFLKWAEDEDATVFQTHLLIYKNQFKIDKYSSEQEKARRKFLVLAEDRLGNLFHVIYYLKHIEYSLYQGTYLVYQLLEEKNMNIIAMINLDTGNYDIIDTMSKVKGCDDKPIKGTNDDRENMTNLLFYHYE